MIERKGKFLVDRDLDGHLSIGIESRMLKACVAEANRRRAYGVFGNRGFNFRENNLDFLSDLSGIRKVHFWEVKLKNIDGIYALKGLRSFAVAPTRPAVDFSRLRELQTVLWHYSPKDTGLGSLENLRFLGLWHFNPKQKSFEGLQLPDSVEELNIAFANPKSLVGLPILPKVRQLSIARCRNLKTIAELPRITPNVEHLVVDACGRVADGPAVVRLLPKLHHAYVRDAVLISRPERKTRLVRRD